MGQTYILVHFENVKNFVSNRRIPPPQILASFCIHKDGDKGRARSKRGKTTERERMEMLWEGLVAGPKSWIQGRRLFLINTLSSGPAPFAGVCMWPWSLLSWWHSVSQNLSRFVPGPSICVGLLSTPTIELHTFSHVSLLLGAEVQNWESSFSDALALWQENLFSFRRNILVAKNSEANWRKWERYEHYHFAVGTREKRYTMPHFFWTFSALKQLPSHMEIWPIRKTKLFASN